MSSPSFETFSRPFRDSLQILGVPGPEVPRETPVTRQGRQKLPTCTFWEGQGGKGPRLERGSRLVGFLRLWVVWAWEDRKP